MQTTLAIETSQAACSVALRYGQDTTQRAQLAQRQHATVLLPMVEALLGDSGLSPSQLDCVAFACGPGSFTGARIAASVAQGLAFGSEACVVPVSSLRALAHTATMELEIAAEALIFIAIDAHMNELYSACYRNDAVFSAVQEDALLSKNDSCQQLASVKTDAQAIQLLGNGLSVMAEYITESKNDFYTQLSELTTVAPEQQSLQATAVSVLQLAELVLLRNEQLAPEQAIPAYLRGSSAWKKITDQ